MALKIHERPADPVARLLLGPEEGEPGSAAEGVDSQRALRDYLGQASQVAQELEGKQWLRRYYVVEVQGPARPGD